MATHTTNTPPTPPANPPAAQPPKYKGVLTRLLDGHPLVEALVFDRTLIGVADWLVGLVKGHVSQNAQHKVERVASRFTFAAAMNVLYKPGPKQDLFVHDAISSFMVHTDGLTTDADREDFEHNTAKVGGIQGTVITLCRLVYQYPDHPARRAHAEAMGWIGKRGEDPMEKAIAAAKVAGNRIATSASTVAGVAVAGYDVVKQGLDDVENHLAQTTANNTNPGTTFRNKWEGELASLTK